MEREPPLTLSEGSCFGLAEAEPSSPLVLLGGRLILTPPAVDLRLDTRLGGPPAGRDTATRLRMHPSREVSLLLWTNELLRTVDAGGLEEAVRTVYDRDPRFAIRSIAETELEAVAAIPRRRVRREELFLLVEVFTRTDDGLVQQTSVFADEATATTPGCQRAALAIVHTLRPGRRALEPVEGRVALRPGLTVELPGPHLVETITRRGASVYSLHGLHPLVAESVPYLGIHVGDSPTFVVPESARRYEGELLGRPARYYETRVLGTRERAALTEVPGLGPVHVFMGADERASLDALQAIVDSLSTEAAADPAPTCEAIDDRAPVSDPALAEDPAVALLLNADRFARSAIGYEEPPNELVAAFRRIAARPDAGAVFEHLAAADGLAARLWGLAGLSATGDRHFDAVFCHVAPTLSGEVEVHELCGPTTVGVGAILETEAAPRAPAFWESNEFAAADNLDLRGGGIGHELRWGPLASEATRESVRMLSGDTPPPTFAGDRRASLIELEADRLCGTRRDGRFACFGAENEWVYGEAIAHPVAVSGRIARCFVDREGKRVCTGEGLDRALAQRARTCGGEPPAPLSSVRAFDDGPWRLVDLGDEPCGIDDEGTLHCFRTSADPPAWARSARQLAFGEAYPVLAGDVAGASRGHGESRWAWSESGRVYRWDAHEGPRAVAELEGLKRIVGGMRITFAEMEDGRVLALGPQPGEPWWDVVGQLGQEWVELPALHGGELTVGAYHGCARFPRGVVKCWGAAGEGQLGAVGGRRAPPTEVRELRGARSLELGTGISCAVVAGGRLRCVGSGAPFLGESDGGRRDIRPQRRLDRIERTTRGALVQIAERPPSE